MAFSSVTHRLLRFFFVVSFYSDLSVQPAARARVAHHRQCHLEQQPEQRRHVVGEIPLDRNAARLHAGAVRRVLQLVPPPGENCVRFYRDDPIGGAVHQAVASLAGGLRGAQGHWPRGIRRGMRRADESH